jgi:hypothetical protein
VLVRVDTAKKTVWSTKRKLHSVCGTGLGNCK